MNAASRRQTYARVLLTRRMLLVGALVTLPVAASAGSLLESLLGKRNSDGFLPPEKAFKVRITASGASSLTATLEPAPGYYLYRDRIELILKNSPGVRIRSIQMPAGERKNDPNFGWTEVYRGAVQVRIDLDRAPPNGKLLVLATYQGCEERRGVCYPPTTAEVAVAMASAR